jgi:hypothetical protein
MERSDVLLDATLRSGIRLDVEMLLDGTLRSGIRWNFEMCY